MIVSRAPHVQACIHAGAIMPSSLDTERASMPPALVQERRPWYDLGFSFTTRQALILLGFLVLGVAFTFALDWVIDRFVHLSEEQIVGWIDDLGALGPIAFILLLAATIIFSPLPSVVVD